MFRKIALGTLLVGLLGVLVGGAIISTENVAEARGPGQGRGAGEQVGYEVQQTGWDPGDDTQRNGGSVLERQYPNYDSAPEERILYEGVVTQAPEAGMDLVVRTSDGQEVMVGTGPGYMETQGFALQVGEPVQVSGYWEDDEFKAFEIMRLADGQTITLRDEAGHPAWAGSGKRATEQQAATDQGEQGQGRGRDQGKGQGN